MEESEKELKSILRKVKQESEKVGLKLNIHCNGEWNCFLNFSFCFLIISV